MPRNTSGLKRGGATRKGKPNKVTGALKDLILQALANVGGSAYLEAQAKTNPNAFLALIGRVLPLQVKADGAEPVVPKAVIHQHLGTMGHEPDGH